MKPNQNQKTPNSRKSRAVKNKNEEPPQIEELTAERLAEQQGLGIGEKREHREMDKRHNDFSRFDETVGERKAREQQADEPSDKGL
ncbi:MAG: hypothetical protein V4615_16965 [Bacteroidota bacterium]